MKRVMIFGSTGSIGKKALEVIGNNKDNSFKVIGLCAYKDIFTLEKQIAQFFPEYVCVVEEESAKRIKKKKNNFKLFYGKQGLKDFSSIGSDVSLMAIVGISCLEPLLINIRHTKRIALANKESIVSAGGFVFEEAKRTGTQILPVDSEINALFQILSRQASSSIEKVYLTASGGPLWRQTKRGLEGIKPQQVLLHPTWRMGARISVDSATLVNKGFEVVEAHRFFGLDWGRIEVLIHRQSYVHALVEFKDRNIFACIYPPDMGIPISFALYYPRRIPFSQGFLFKGGLNFSFEPIASKRFPLFKLILEAARKEDNSLTILNACDEVAIDYFLKGKIKFIEIQKVMEHLFSVYPSQKIKRIEDVFFWDAWAREKSRGYLERLCN